jgi:hypothetical protein
MVHPLSGLRRISALLFLAGIALSAAPGQTVQSGALPDAPPANTGAQQDPPAVSSTAQSSLSGRQTRRILGIIPNFRSVSVDQKLPPQSAGDKFKETSEDAFDYSDFVFVGMLAGIAQAENSYPEFHQGAAGFGRYYWHTLADQVDEDYQVEFIFPVVFHQDSRYYTLGRGGLLKRTAYSFSRILITRTDSGGETFNASEVIGAGAASGISDLYYPSIERTWTKTGQRWLVNVGLDGATFIFKEYWPDLNDRFFHQKD